MEAQCSKNLKLFTCDPEKWGSMKNLFFSGKLSHLSLPSGPEHPGKKRRINGHRNAAEAFPITNLKLT